jgi:gamma-glutamyl-gamma-aminobutyrate hydrolase PuuD
MLANEQMNVLRHHYVADHHQVVALAHLLPHVQEQITVRSAAQQGSTLITIGGDEMQVSSAVVTMETSRPGAPGSRRPGFGR